MGILHIRRLRNCDSCKHRMRIVLSTNADAPQANHHQTCSNCDRVNSIQIDEIKRWIVDEQLVEKIKSEQVKDRISQWASAKNGDDCAALDDLRDCLLRLAELVRPDSSSRPKAQVGMGDVGADYFEEVILDATKMTGEDLRKEFSGLRTQLKHLTESLRNLQESAGQVQTHHQQSEANQKALLESIDPKRKTSLVVAIERVRRGVDELRKGNAATDAANGKQSKALEEAVRRIVEEVAGLTRQPVDVDAEIVAERLVSILTGSGRIHTVLDQLTESFFKSFLESFFNERRRALEKLADDLPKLFDALEYPYRTWEIGNKLTPDEHSAREQVLHVLTPIRDEIRAWKHAHQIEDVPSESDPHCRFDASLHDPKRIVPTQDPDKHQTIERVIKLGYQWPNGKLRRAQVTVYSHPAESGHSADGASGVHAERTETAPDRPATRSGSIDERS